MTTEQMHVIAKITDARTFERQLEQTVEEAAEFIQAAQKIKRYPGNSLQMNHLVEETGDLLITLEQIRIYLVRDGYGDALNSMIDYKLNRELGRMEQERKDNESKAYHNRRKRNPSKGGGRLSEKERSDFCIGDSRCSSPVYVRLYGGTQ